ncbi:hypothetical protein ACFLWN_02915 [Chloroflexota bacterium]
MARVKLVLTRFLKKPLANIINLNHTRLLTVSIYRGKGGSMRCLVRTRACRRCGGDLSLERDHYGTYAACIQCGAVWDTSDMMPPEARIKPQNQERKPVTVK